MNCLNTCLSSSIMPTEMSTNKNFGNSLPDTEKSHLALQAQSLHEFEPSRRGVTTTVFHSPYHIVTWHSRNCQFILQCTILVLHVELILSAPDFIQQLNARYAEGVHRRKKALLFHLEANEEYLSWTFLSLLSISFWFCPGVCSPQSSNCDTTFAFPRNTKISLRKRITPA